MNDPIREILQRHARQMAAEKPVPVSIVISPETIEALRPKSLHVTEKTENLLSKLRSYNGLNVIPSDALKPGKFFLLDAEGRIIWDY